MVCNQHFTISLSLTNLCLASDQAREKKHADEILASLVVGEEVWLPNGDQPFLGLFTAAEDTSTDAVILLHGTGVHPNWPDVISPARGPARAGLEQFIHPVAGGLARRYV
ncbi:MAG: DUF3530 family protein [Gammaproteobacteria bacterium]